MSGENRHSTKRHTRKLHNLVYGEHPTILNRIEQNLRYLRSGTHPLHEDDHITLMQLFIFLQQLQNFLKSIERMS